jgi:hypothetical protein
MMFWSTLWMVVFVVSMLVFAGVAVMVTIGGIGDIRALFRRMDERHEENGDW